MNYSILQLILPLASEKFNSASSWLMKMFSAIRRSGISSASISVEMAMGVAALLIVFKMIKLSYDIMSDEQTSGFGGITLWQVLRPVVILLLIQSCTLWVGALDGLTNAVTSSISKSINVMSDKEQVLRAFQKDETIQSAFGVDDAQAAIARADSSWAEYVADIEAYNPQSAGLLHLFEKSMKRSWEKRELREAMAAASEDPEKSGKAIRCGARNYINAFKHTTKGEDGDAVFDIHDKNIIPAICCWLYDRFYIVVQCFAEILLIVLAMCAPWMLVISLLEPWKQAIWSFITAYVQVSFWKVIAAIIHFATISFRGGAVKFILDSATDDMIAAVNGVMPSARPGAAIIVSAIASVAGLFALLKIQDIAAAIIPSASAIGSASGGAGTAQAAMMAPVNVVGKTAGAAVGGVKAVNGLKAGKKQ